MTEKQKEKFMKSIEIKLNCELKFIYGLENICFDSSLNEQCEDIISQYFEDNFDHHSFFNNVNKDCFCGNQRFFIKDLDISIEVILHKLSFKNIDSFETVGYVESLKRKTLSKDYIKLLKNNNDDEFELNTFWVSCC